MAVADYVTREDLEETLAVMEARALHQKSI